MADFTKRAIMQTFSEMLEEMPFDKITVSALIRRCGISHNTFYYHYQDIYQLLEVCFWEDLGRHIHDYEDWKEDLKEILLVCRKRRKTVYHVFNSLSRDRLEHYIFTTTDDLLLRYVSAQPGAERASPELLQATAEFCRYAILGYFLKFLWNDMEADLDRDVEILELLFQGFIKNAFTRELPPRNQDNSAGLS